MLKDISLQSNKDRELNNKWITHKKGTDAFYTMSKYREKTNTSVREFGYNLEIDTQKTDIYFLKTLECFSRKEMFAIYL